MNKVLTTIKSIYKEFSHKDLILVYNMGKVGSSSLVSAIPNAIQIHTLYSDLPPINTRIKNMSMRQNLVFYISRLISLLAIKNRKKTKILVIIRNPVKRNRSMFFQDLELWLTKYNLEVGVNKSEYRLDPIFEAYANGFDHMYYENWFDEELYRLTKLNIFDAKLVNNSISLSNNKYDVLCLKLENLLESKSLLDSFVGCDVKLENKNVGTKKWYGDIYKEFSSFDLIQEEKSLLEGRVATQFGYKQ